MTEGVTKDDIIKDIASETGISESRVREAADFQFKQVAEGIRNMNSIRLPYWGVYRPLPGKEDDT